MGQRLTADDFNNLFRYFTATAVRLEVQPVYAVTDERESVDEFLAGEPRPVTEFPFYAQWLDRIRTATAHGKRVERVRVLDEPPTDYQRWEIWSGQYNAAAGETIRYLRRSRALQIGVPVTDDWWMFDSQHVALMRFAADGEPLGGEIVSDPTIVSRHRAWWDLAVAHSSPTPPAREHADRIATDNIENP
jgi:Family of unknown function (DUF6879)